ncbi:alanine racemase [Rickettsiella endosymbiont of Litargus connexus]|jgi:alanine racemase|uniref:alanine racemase n=1 Tax=Rickettsiella endosymbiont of Litargus connexus TaxID=3066237 RepID=UPI00376F2780|nr:alanine racemase [Gammaproteobacteria bacterium]MCH9755205.1 alanine racemase [Gammaproteobacteria bacterium]MDD4892531.1 alanine racemase [Candidatus Rickettsiella isopodorum]MDD5162486.1 alanine racemase [Candidatus Rickettsiella isopodorum]
MSRPFTVELDLGALRHNVKRIREIAPQSQLLAMVKANAYGHGLLSIAKALSDVEGFGVSCSEEALYLRQAGLKQRIVLMEGLFSKDEIPLLTDYELDTVIHDCNQLNWLSERPLPATINVWLKINTGMNRLGFSPNDFEAVLEKLHHCSWLNIVCVMTHFSSADKPEDTTTKNQIKRFDQVLKECQFPTSLANSAAILAFPKVHADWVRPGLILYGVSPFSESSGVQYALKPVMTLKSEIISIHQLKPGDRVGYGGTWIAPKPLRVGIVAIGYGDGYPHRAESGTPILVNGKLSELIGQVSMDMLTVNLSNQWDAKIGDPVVLWGTGLPIEQIAESTSSFRFELLCGINRGQLVRTRIEEINDAKKNH